MAPDTYLWCHLYIPVKYYGLDVVTIRISGQIENYGVVGKDYGFMLVWGCNVLVTI